MASGYSLLRAWLQQNHFSVECESITVEGMELSVRAPDGQRAKLIYEPGTEVAAGLKTLQRLFFKDASGLGE